MPNRLTEEDELMLELELVPIARAMVHQDNEITRKINPAWCLRPESMRAYITLKTTSDEQMMATFTQFMQTDRYMQLAVQNIGSDATTQSIGQKMYEGWVKRTEYLYITKILNAKSAKEKLSYANAIKGLYHQVAPEAYVIDMAHPSPPEDFLMTFQDVDYRPRGDLSIIKAKAKAGKSTYLKIEIAAMISPTGEVNGMSRSMIPGTDQIRDPYRVLWIDTEQSFASSDKSYFQVLQMAGLPMNQNSDNLKMVNLRMMHNQNRLSRVEEEVEHGQWDVVVLDGIKDVAKNVNDPIETDAIINRVLQLIQDSKVAFITVIHENPAKDTDKMRGWLGTELGNKGFEVQEVRNDQDTGVFTVLNTERREKTIPAYGFKYDEEDNLVQCEPEVKAGKDLGPGPGPQTPTKEEKQWNQFTKAFESDFSVSLSQEQIIQNLLAIGMSETTIKRRLKKYKAKRMILPMETDKGTRFYVSPAEVSKIRERMQGDQAPF